MSNASMIHRIHVNRNNNCRAALTSQSEGKFRPISEKFCLARLKISIYFSAAENFENAVDSVFGAKKDLQKLLHQLTCSDRVVNDNFIYDSTTKNNSK